MKRILAFIILLIVPANAFAFGTYERIDEGKFYYSNEMQSQYQIEAVTELDLMYGPRSYWNIPNPELLKANQVYNSYLISWQGDLELGPMQATSDIGKKFEEFDGRIAAVIYESDQLWTSDMVFGGNSPECSETLDPQHCHDYRGIEYSYSDYFKISESKIDFKLYSNKNYFDQMRILTVPVPESSNSLVVMISCFLIAATFHQRKAFTGKHQGII